MDDYDEGTNEGTNEALSHLHPPEIQTKLNGNRDSSIYCATSCTHFNSTNYDDDDDKKTAPIMGASITRSRPTAPQPLYCHN